FSDPGPVFHTIVSIKNDGHYFCRAGGNRPDGLNEPVTAKPLSRLVYTNLKTARTNSVSIQSVASRFKELLGKLPVPSAEIMRQAQELRDFDEARRMPYVVSGSPD
ncbi:hypothetical protein QS291_23850, partial [Escherichia coli]|nr:hypothetical protein [Escherichia coli]